MPPKRKAAAGKAGGKKAKKEEAAGPASMKDVASALKAEDKKVGGKKSHTVDQFCTISGSVVGDYDCMLNQTNIGHNNNKFYVIQVLQQCGSSYTWNRWGRVGESGSNSLKAMANLDAAVKDFEKKFRDKTKNKWSDRAKFSPQPGKYTLIEMADEDEDEVDAPGPSALIVSKGGKVADSTLDKATQKLMKLVFDNDMFNDCMKKFDIDVKKMPLGKLSKGQIAKGFEVLDELEKEINANRTGKLNDLSSRFYTVIPHNFGRMIPPPIRELESLRAKMEMLMVLGDIEVALSLQKEKDKKMNAGGDVQPNPLDTNYGLLNCELELVDKSGKEFKVIEKYTKETGGGWRIPKIQSVWKVNRDGEGSRFKVHDKMGNRKLLWHGTNVAVVAAILKSGLRIMPHSGGRVGAGIYFASENSKSAGYVGTVGTTGIMLLNEVALGRENHVLCNQSELKAAPAGYDSVLAIGRTEPNPKNDTKFKMDGKDVVVPQGKPINVAKAKLSHFSQSEYLIYKESQTRIRYLLLMDFS